MGRRIVVAGGVIRRVVPLGRAGRMLVAVLVSVAVAAMVGVGSAGAVVTTGSPRGIVPHHNGSSSGQQFLGQQFLGQQFPQSSLQYFGGPVLRTNETFAIFWDPSGGFSPGYRDLVTRYLQDVAADSGQTTNAYSVLNQYYDTTGPIAYASTFAGSAIDTDPYPTGCPTSSAYPACFTDQQLANELDGFLSANNIARPANRAFFVFTPAGVNTCFGEATFNFCASSDFCAYHSSFTSARGDTLYADLPYAARFGCDYGQHPNASDADPVIDALSHEHKEMIDDPLIAEASGPVPPAAWFDPSSGQESSDKCASYYGPIQSNGVGDYNQVINGHDYLLQTEWSNALAAAQGLGCVDNGTDHAPTAAAVRIIVHNGVAAFDATGSTDPDSGDTLTYVWSFGDGSVATGQSVNHQYAAPGTYTVVLQTVDNHAAAAQTTQNVTIGVTQPDLPCSQEASLRSHATPTSTQITFTNESTATVKVYWLNYSGVRVLYRQLLPGRSYVQGTYVTHPWVVANSTGACIGIYLGHGSPSNAIIGG